MSTDLAQIAVHHRHPRLIIEYSTLASPLLPSENAKYNHPMHLTGLQLENFRNHTSLVQTFSPGITLIYGPNGAGKTNILEAIYLLSTGKSNRAGKVIEMVNWDADLGRVLAKLESSESPVVAQQSRSKSEQTSNSRHPELDSGSPTELGRTSPRPSPKRRRQPDPKAQDSSISQDDAALKLELTLTRGSLHGQKIPYKKFSIDGVNRSQKKFAYQFNVVWFGPADMRLIEGSPTRRRDFLDETISQINPEYAYALRELTKLLPRRNQVLFQIREKTIPLNQLKYWDQQLCILSEQIHNARQNFVDFINQQGQRHPELDSGSPSELTDNMKVKTKLDYFDHYFLQYTPKTISFAALPEIRNREIATATTLRGPHRDDFDVTDAALTTDPVSLRTYGSRGQQRMAIIWLKLMALEFIAADRGVRPILLLDDVMSELDTDHRDVIHNLITKQQTIITSAEHLKIGQTEETHLKP